MVSALPDAIDLKAHGTLPWTPFKTIATRIAEDGHAKGTDDGYVIIIPANMFWRDDGARYFVIGV